MSRRLEVARVLAELGPDLTASEWADRLDVSRRTIDAIAGALGIELARPGTFAHRSPPSTLRELELRRELERARAEAEGLRLALVDADG